MKNIITITVPSGTHYLSDFQIEGKHFELPNGILNKEITGCGGTTLALKDNHKTIICSPRIRLLENKHRQFNDKTLFVIGGVAKTIIAEYISQVDVPKILVTYDSLQKVLDCIDDIENWRIVVDEFQCLLNDSTFKADVEMKFLERLKSLPYVTYLSATPILDKYLAQIPYFNDVDYYQLNWIDKTKVNLYRYRTNNPKKAISRIINNYIDGNYPTLPMENGDIITSREAVIFLNSVTNIVNLVKSCKLSPEDVNIIVANNEDNEAIIKKLGVGYSNGTIPLMGEEHKRITMCTSTAYMGVDFYSTCASTFVVSDCNMANTSVDIATELCQIAGRQRLESNPFRNQIYFIYNTNVTDISPGKFNNIIEHKMRLTKLDVDSLNNMDEELKAIKVKEIRNRIKILGFQDYYTTYDDATKMFVCNTLAQISEIWAYEVQHCNYENGLFVKEQLESTNKFEVSATEPYLAYKRIVTNTIAQTAFKERMTTYCEYREDGRFISNYIANDMANKHPELKIYYDALGVDKIKALSYQESKLKEEYNAVDKATNIQHKINKLFKNGDRITNADLKVRIQEIYNDLGLKKKAKATDITQYGFSTRSIKIDSKDGKRLNGVEIRKIVDS